MIHPVGVWAEPPCCYCGLSIQPSSDPTRPVQRVERGYWSHAECWEANRKAYQQLGRASFYQQRMEGL